MLVVRCTFEAEGLSIISEICIEDLATRTIHGMNDMSRLTFSSRQVVSTRLHLLEYFLRLDMSSRNCSNLLPLL